MKSLSASIIALLLTSACRNSKFSGSIRARQYSGLKEESANIERAKTIPTSETFLFKPKEEKQAEFALTLDDRKLELGFKLENILSKRRE